MMIHGHAQTADDMAKKSGAIRSEVKKLADFHFVESQLFDECGERTWFKYRPFEAGTTKHYEGLAESVRFLAKEMEEHGPFDGLWGFSMGAMMAALLAESQHPDSTLSVIAPDIQIPRFRFALLFSAPLPKDPQAVAVLRKDGGIPVPSLHCWGTDDQIIAPQRSEALCKMFAAPQVEVHPGGHLMPSSAPVRKGVKAFLKQFM